MFLGGSCGRVLLGAVVCLDGVGAGVLFFPLAGTLRTGTGVGSTGGFVEGFEMGVGTVVGTVVGRPLGGSFGGNVGALMLGGGAICTVAGVERLSGEVSRESAGFRRTFTRPSDKPQTKARIKGPNIIPAI